MQGTQKAAEEAAAIKGAHAPARKQPDAGQDAAPGATVTAFLSGNFAWDIQGSGAPVPQTGRFLEGPPVAELRQLDIALSPHGFLKAALAGDAAAISQPIVGPSDGGRSANGRKVTIVSFKALGKYRVNGTGAGRRAACAHP